MQTLEGGKEISVVISRSRDYEEENYLLITKGYGCQGQGYIHCA